MTLVAGLSVGGMPAFLSDLLISRRIPSAVDLPTRPEPGVHTGLGFDHAAGLAQKLVLVRPYLMIAWAGGMSEVRRLIREIDVVLPPATVLHSDILEALSILDTCGAGTELLALFNFEGAIHPFGVRTRGFELEGRRIYLLGTGATAFFEYLQSHPAILPGQERADGQMARAIMLRFAARAMTSQWIAGAGLSESWGGGFEVAYPEETGFKKIGNVLTRGWLIDNKGNFHNSGRSYFSRYYGNDLHLSCLSPQELTYRIPSPVGPSSPIPNKEVVSPDWTVDSFFMEKNGSIVEFARFQPPHRPVKDQFALRDGVLAGWSMDKEYVEELVRRAIDECERGGRFEIQRY